MFHNAAENTPEALPGIIESLIADGYKIVPISQILLTRGLCDRQQRQTVPQVDTYTKDGYLYRK